METAYLKSDALGGRNSYAEKSTIAKISTVRNILYIVYGIIPIAAGLDKFFNILTNWEKYINPLIANILPISTRGFMMIAGVIEIAAGILVFARPKIGAYVVSAWLLVIALKLLAGWIFPDIAVRDIAMAAGAFCLGQIEESM